ncbi:MAG: PAS domain S-box protein, partial [Acetobacteraceae bacterium]
AASLRRSGGTPRPTGYAELDGIAADVAGLLEECRLSEARLLIAQEAAGIGCWDCDPRSGEQFWSRQQYALHGLDPAGPAPSQAAWRRMVHPEDRPGLAQATRCDPPTFTAEFRIRRADDGAERWIAASGRIERDADGRPVRMLGINRDVTEQRLRATELASREAALRAMVEANPIGVMRSTRDGAILDANDALLRIIGRDRTALEAGVLRWDTITPEDWRAANDAAIATAAATGRSIPYEKEYQRPDGSRIPVLVGFSMVGSIREEAIAFVLDLSERKRAERLLLEAKAALEQRVAERTAALAEREADLRRIYDRTPAAFHSCDAAGRLIEVSAQWLAFLGYAREAVLGHTPAEFMTAESASRWEVARASLTDGRDEVREVEYRMVRQDGRIVDVLLRARAERDAGGGFRRSFAVLLDITERNRSETRLREAQKLEALGRIAGGVAHDFNNILQVVNGALRLVQTRPEDPVRVRRYAAAALAAAERGADVTRRMLAFARRDQLQAGPVPPAAVLEGLSALLRGALGPDIRLEVSAPPGLPQLQADRMQLDLVLFNLALNARDAMPEGGTLRLTAEPADALVDGPASLAPGHYLKLTVADTGAGMDALTLARATEPFFTTKEVGKGTGLGLAMAHGFAVQSGGALTLESAPGRGTVVSLFLPEVGASVGAATGAEAAPPPLSSVPAARSLRLLMVEDDAPVRGVMATALREEGLQVTEAADAMAALALIGSGQEFDVVLTDQVMPGMTGSALATELARRRPGLPVMPGMAWSVSTTSN